MGKFEDFLVTKQFKNIMAKLYGIGAAVVIAGALFKIMHWPGANAMLIAGMGTEVLIFVVSAFEPIHMDLDWTLVYPELAGMHDGHGDKKEDKKSVTETLDKMLEKAKIGPELIESLGSGTIGNSMTELEKASSKTSQALDLISNSTSQQAGSYSESLGSFSKNLSALNSA